MSEAQEQNSFNVCFTLHCTLSSEFKSYLHLGHHFLFLDSERMALFQSAWHSAEINTIYVQIK